VLYVNLVEDRLQQKRFAERVLLVGTLAVIVLILVLVGTVLSYRMTARDLQRQIKEFKEKTAAIQPQADEAKRLQDQIAILEPLQEVANQVHSTSIRWCWVLDSIGSQLPPNVSLQEISSASDAMTKALRVRVRGLAAQKDLVSIYIDRLNSLRWFDRSGTLLTDLGTQSVAGLDLANFSIELLVAGTAEPKPEEKKPAQKGGEEAGK